MAAGFFVAFIGFFCLALYTKERVWYLTALGCAIGLVLVAGGSAPTL